MTLFWHGSGPKIAYEGGILRIEDLNPQVAMEWRGIETWMDSS
jgi:hypothetical protein